jgi:hypothetical protein
MMVLLYFGSPLSLAGVMRDQTLNRLIDQHAFAYGQGLDLILVHKDPTRHPYCTFGHGESRNRAD